MRFTAFDASYLERLQQHDDATEQHFVAYFGELLRLKLRARLSSAEAIEDIRQETFARVLTLVRSEQGVRVPEGLGSLVNSVCNYVLLEHYHAIDRGFEGIEAQPDEFLASTGLSVTGEIGQQELALAVRKVLGELNTRDRQLLELVVLEERSKDEVCAQFGLTREHLRVLLHRARHAFKACYVKRFGDTGSGGGPAPKPAEQPGEQAKVQSKEQHAVPEEARQGAPLRAQEEEQPGAPE